MMNRKIVRIIALLPISGKFRGILYKKVLKYNIGKNFFIGFGSYIETEFCQIGDEVKIGNLVRAKYLDSFILGDNSSIGSNTIICGAYNKNKFSIRAFEAGHNVEILSSHYFDVVAPIHIGSNVTIAGKWTQFYTHSFDLESNRMDGSIKIGNNIYIGAGCIINLGVFISDKVVLQAGTCVNKSIHESGVYASNTFFRRGNVRNYHDIVGHEKEKRLDSKKSIFFKEE